LAFVQLGHHVGRITAAVGPEASQLAQITALARQLDELIGGFLVSVRGPFP